MTTTTRDPRSWAARSDFWVGAVLTGLGLTAAQMARGFDATSRSYPLILALLLAAVGVVLALRGALRRGDQQDFGGPLQGALPAVAVLVLWIVALGGGLGFVLPTLAMQLAFLALAGMSLRRALPIALLVTFAGYLIFVLGLEVRLPSARLPWLL